MRRRRLLAYSAAAVGFAGCLEGGGEDTAPTFTEVESIGPTQNTTERARESTVTPRIGGSLNGRPFRLEDDIELLQQSETTWLHAFLDVREKYEQDVTPREDPDVVALRRAIQEVGTKLVVSLQWDFMGLFGDKGPTNLPPAGSAHESALIEYATELLAAVDEDVDIVVLGNEPVWETLDEDFVGRNTPLIHFTRTLKEHLVQHYATGDTQFLLGAFNRLYGNYVSKKYHRFYSQLFEMARNDDDIAGIDLHVHYEAFGQAERMLAVARKAFPAGVVTVTEFSPMWRYAQKKNEPITSFEGGERFADRYGIASSTTVTEYFEAAKDDRLSATEAADFMDAMPWYNVDFVEDMYDLMDRYDVTVGTFGFLVERGIRNVDWTEEWAPFAINCLFQPGLIETDNGAHPHYIDDYRVRA